MKNKKLIVVMIISVISMMQYIRLIISARYYGNIEFNNKTVNDDNIPFGISRVSAFVTDSNSYTTVTWVIALFVFIVFAISSIYLLKLLLPYMYVKLNKEYIDQNNYNLQTKQWKLYKFVSTYGAYFIAILMFIQTFRVGFYAAIDLEKTSGHLMYMIAYVPYWIFNHPITAIVAVAVFISIISFTPRFSSLAEKQQHIDDQNRRAVQDQMLKNAHKNHKLF